MPINNSGPVSLGGGTSGVSIAFEVGVGATTQISLNDTNVRTLAGVPSGQIVMPTNFYGKSNAFTFNKTISSNTQNYNLLNDMVANGYTNGSAFTANITIASGIYVWSDNTSLAGFDTGNITGTGTINITNNGFIIGKGGTGGGSIPRVVSPGVTIALPGLPGGSAINTVTPLSITNNSFIAGGGGGGATFGTHGTSNSTNAVGGGGGAGGGVGGAGTTHVPSTIFTPGGAGGGLGSSGGNGSVSNQAGGGGGGRILPGVGGPSLSNGPPTSGAGGSGGNAGGTGTYGTPFPTTLRVQGGLGGGAGGSGALQTVVAKAGPSVASAGGGGGWGAIGGNGFFNTTIYSPGGSGGKAINTNGSSITFVTTGTVYGAVN